MGCFEVVLSEDCTIDIMTRAGADAFIQEGLPYNQSNIKNEAKPMRQKLEAGGARLSNKQRQDMMQALEQVYVMIGCVAENSSVEVFCLVEESQLECLISYACEIFSKITKDKKWRKTGVLQKYDQELLQALTASMWQLSFVGLCIAMENDAERDLLAILAQLCAARDKTKMPCPKFTESIFGIVNAYFRLSLVMDGSELESIFKKLEATGILGQVLRCIAKQNVDPDDLRNHLLFLDNILQCSELVKGKFKPGQPTGDILAAIIAGKDGYKGSPNKGVMNRLENLQKMSSKSTEKVGELNPEGNCFVGKACRKCNKREASIEFQSILFVCSRCENTYYCCKKCQKADWKAHKKTCGPVDEELAKATPGLQRTIHNWTQLHYYDIMNEFDRITREKKIDKQELVLELDLCVDEQGSAPAFRTPHEFKVGITRRYLEGTRPDEPDWYGRGTGSVYQMNIDNFLANAQDQYQRMTSDHLLVIARYPSGDSGIYRLRVVSETTGVGLWSDEAMDAFSRALINDDSRLGRVYGERQLANIKARRDLETMNRLRDLSVR